MSHDPLHPPDVITVESGSLKVYLPPHLKSMYLEGTRKAFRDTDEKAYISVIRVEKPDGKVYTYGPIHEQPLEVEIAYTYNGEPSQSASKITVAANTAIGKSVVVQIPTQLSQKLRRELFSWPPFYKTVIEEGVQIKSVRISSGETELHASCALSGKLEVQIMYYRRGFLRRLVDYVFGRAPYEQRPDPDPQAKPV
jgi:hypothetical protein